MKVFKSYTLGMKRAASEKKMIFLLWLFNVLFASVIYYQFSDYLEKVLGTSAAAANFLKAIDFNSVFEMLTFDGAALGTIVSLAIYVGLFYGVFSIFLSGGILQVLVVGRNPNASGEKRHLAAIFFKGAGQYFGRFFRLFLYSLVLLAGVAVALMVLAMILSPITQRNTNEALLFYVVLAEVIVGLFLVFMVRMIVDYARIRIVVENSRAVVLSLFDSIGFVFRRLGKTLGLYYLYLLTGAAVIAIFWVIKTGIKTYSLLPILIAFVVGQLFILSRGWLRVALQAAQMDFFRSVPPPTPVEETIPVSEPVGARIPADEQASEDLTEAPAAKDNTEEAPEA